MLRNLDAQIYEIEQFITNFYNLLGSTAKCTDVVNTKGENINICWSPNGTTIGVGNKVTFVFIRVNSVVKLLA